MKIQSLYKVPQGKLLKITIETNTDKKNIEQISITGDFFAYPEESIQKLEKMLLQKPFDKKQLSAEITSFITSNNVQFIGIDADSITEAIMRCVQ
jgi:lipoate---protein ligase